MQDFGFSSAHFQKVEAGKKAVALYTAYRIAKALSVKIVAMHLKTWVITGSIWKVCIVVLCINVRYVQRNSNGREV